MRRSCGMACRRRLGDWQGRMAKPFDGVWARLHRSLLDRLGGTNAIGWSQASLGQRLGADEGGRADRPEPDRPRPAGRARSGTSSWTRTACPWRSASARRTSTTAAYRQATVEQAAAC